MKIKNKLSSQSVNHLINYLNSSICKSFEKSSPISHFLLSLPSPLPLHSPGDIGMEQLNECLFLTLLFCYNYRLNYFGTGNEIFSLKDILTDLIYVILFSISRINSYYSRASTSGKIYQSIWYIIQLAIDIFLLVAHCLNWWETTFLTSLFTRMVLTVAIWVVQFSTSQIPSTTTWTFFFVCCFHGILASDLIRMSCFFATYHPLKQLLPLYLFILFATLNLGLMFQRAKGSRTIISRVCFVSLLTALVTFCSWRLFLFRYEFSSDHFLTTKDFILALQVLKKLKPYIEVNQIIETLFPQSVLDVLGKFINGGANLTFLYPLLKAFSLVYPLEMEFATIRREPGLTKKKHPIFDELSIFTIHPFDLYKGSKVNKKLFKERAMNTTSRYYNWIMWELWIMFAVGVLANFSAIIGELMTRRFIKPTQRIGKRYLGKVKDSGFRLFGKIRGKLDEKGWLNWAKKTKSE